MNNPTPRAVFEHALELLLAKEMDRFVDLFAEDAHLELPFAVPGGLRRLDGRERLRDYLADYPQRLDIAAFPVADIHETGDPEVVIAELTARGTTVRTGAAYELSYVAVIRVHDGRIAAYRDYWSPVAGAIATGTLPELLTELTALAETDRR